MDDRRAIGKAVLLALCWILSFAAMSVSLTDTGMFSFWTRVFVPVMMIFGYLFLWKIPRVFFRWQLWITAAVFAAVVTVGASFDSVGTIKLVTTQKLKALVYFLGRVPAFYMGMALVLETMKKGRPPHRQYPAWAYALALLVCWLPYLLTVWPGSVSGEAAARLSQIAGTTALSSESTLLQTGLIWLASVTGRGIFGSADAAVALYVLAQALLMAWLLGRVVSLIAVGGTPKWLILSSLLFFAVCPIFPLYAFAVSADTSFALAALWLMIILWRLMRSEQPTLRDVISLSVSAVLCALLRSFGIWLAAVPLAVLLIWSLVRRNEIWKGAMYALACAACALFILQAALLPMLPGKGGAAETVAAEAPVSYGYLMPGYVSDVNPTFILGAEEGAETVSQVTANPHTEAMEAVFNRLLTYAPFRILASPGAYGWIALFALAVVLAQKRWKMLLYLLVPLMALAGCLASPVNGSLGYALPVCLAAPVFLAALAQAVRKAEADAL